MNQDRSVTVVESGRSGQVVYREAGRELSFYWELGAGDIVASVRIGTGAEWRANHAWAADRRSGIMTFVAAEVVRQKAPASVAEVDEQTGWMHLRHARAARAAKPPAAPGFSFKQWQAARTMLAVGVLVVALAVGGLMWFKNTLLVIDPGKGAPLGRSVRTDRHIATLIQTLEPYTPSPNRDHSKNTYTVSIFIVPLDGARPALVPISGGHSANSLGLAKVLGSDGQALWFDVKGAGAVHLANFRLIDAAAGRGSAPANLQGSSRFPLAPSTESYLSAGFFTGPDVWLGLGSATEIERSFRPKQWIRPVVHADDAKQMRRFHRGTVGDLATTGSRQVLSMEPIGQAEYLNAAFLRMHDKAEPLRLRDPEGALMIYTSAPGLAGTLMVARVDTAGGIAWTVDTAIDRFNLLQILPGEQSFAFVGARVPVPGKVPEPILVIVDNGTGAITTHSLWR